MVRLKKELIYWDASFIDVYTALFDLGFHLHLFEMT